MTPTGPHPQVQPAPGRGGATRAGRGSAGRKAPSNRPSRRTWGSYREHISEEELPRDSEVCALVTVEEPAAGGSLE
jgi:hypothetical protein